MTQEIAQKILRILMLEDSQVDAELNERELRKAGLQFTAKRVDSMEAFSMTLKSFRPDLILSDYNLPGFSGIAALGMVRQDCPEVPVIFVTGALSDEEAANLINSGAKDYVLKDRLARLAPAVQRALSVEQGVKIRKLTEAQLHEKTELLENVINSSHDYIFVKDRELRTILCNNIFAQALGKRPEDLYGKTDIENGWDAELVKGNPEKGIRGFEQDDLEALAGNVVHSTTDLGNIGGEIRNFDSVKVPLKSSNGLIFGMLGISRDITEQKLAEAALRQYAHDMRERIKEMSCLNDIITISLMRELSVEQLLEKCVRRIPDAWLDPSTICARIRLGNQIFETPDFNETKWKLEAAIQHVGKESGAVEVFYKGGENDDKNNPFLDEERALINAIALQLGLSLERRRAEINLLKSEEELRHAQSIAQIGHFRFDRETGLVEGSDELFRIFGLTKEQFQFSAFLEAVHPDDRAIDAATIDAAIKGKTGYTLEHRLLLGDGTLKWVRAIGEFVSYSPEGHPLLIGTVQDITEHIKSEERLRLTAKVFENTMEGIIVTDKDGRIIEVNDAFTHITGYAHEEVIGKTTAFLKSGYHDKDFYAVMWQAINATGHWRGEIWNRRKDGDIYPEMLTISTIMDSMNRVTNYLGVFSDITILKQHERQLEHIAHYDALTGVPNRVLLADRLHQAIAFSKRQKKLLAVCYLDLDGFKAVNDSMGHEAGDQVLIEVSRRIKNIVREGDTVARLGGDEFVILLSGFGAKEEYHGSLDRLIDAVSEPIYVMDKLFKLSASIGVSIYPNDADNPDTLLRHADQAMYSAKQSGRNRYYLYDVAHDQRARTFQEFTKQVRQGLAQGEFELFFQPKVDLSSMRPIGAEALIRWRHQELGLISPVEFLPAIENTELDVEVGEWVIAKVIDQLVKWRQAGIDIELSINISAYHMQSPDFCEKLRQKLSTHPGLPHGRLQIEILETAALKDVAAAKRIIDLCRSFGVGFALDDFGTGYSSLSYLSNLPVDTLKIDQSFIRDMLEDKGDFAIVQGVIALSKAFNLKTVAEGVESERCFSALVGLGCEFGQGYVIAKPMPAVDFSDWYKEKCASAR